MISGVRRSGQSGRLGDTSAGASIGGTPPLPLLPPVPDVSLIVRAPRDVIGGGGCQIILFICHARARAFRIRPAENYTLTRIVPGLYFVLDVVLRSTCSTR